MQTAGYDIKFYKKISVVGNSAAGKSTLSRKLGVLLEKEVYSIDKIYWLPGWKQRDLESFKVLHNKWLSIDSWVIDGVGYWEEMGHRMSLSDLIIFLDTPINLCKERAEARMFDEKHAPNNNITTGCVYGEVKQKQLDVIEQFHSELRPKLIKYLAMFDPMKVRVITSFEELSIENET